MFRLPRVSSSSRAASWGVRGLAVLCAGLVAACTPNPPRVDAGPAVVADAGPSETDGGMYPLATTDFVARTGDDDTFDVATWNIENFPKSQFSVEYAANIIRSMDLELVAVQEIGDDAAFAELLERLPEHEGRISTHVYPQGWQQKLGFIWKPSRANVKNFTMLFAGSGYQFPRPPVSATIEVLDEDGEVAFDFVALSVHLKASYTGDSQDRRKAAINMLDTYVRQRITGAEKDYLLLGDFNESMTTASGAAVYAPMANATDTYIMLSAIEAENGGVTYVPGRRMIDHMIATTDFNGELRGQPAEVRRLDGEVNNFVSAVSDHVPVVLSIDMP